METYSCSDEASLREQAAVAPAQPSPTARASLLEDKVRLASLLLGGIQSRWQPKGWQERGVKKKLFEYSRKFLEY